MSTRITRLQSGMVQLLEVLSTQHSANPSEFITPRRLEAAKSPLPTYRKAGSSRAQAIQNDTWGLTAKCSFFYCRFSSSFGLSGGWVVAEGSGFQAIALAGADGF